MATHSSILAWRIPGTEEPGGLLSMGSRRVRHNWSDLAAAAAVLRKHGRIIKLDEEGWIDSLISGFPWIVWERMQSREEVGRDGHELAGGHCRLGCDMVARWGSTFEDVFRFLKNLRSQIVYLVIFFSEFFGVKANASGVLRHPPTHFYFNDHNLISETDYRKAIGRDFPHGPVVTNSPCNAAHAGSIPGWGTGIPCTTEQLSPCTATRESVHHKKISH